MNPYRLLVVEDEGIVAMDIEQRLAALGYDVAGSTGTGERALELAENERPDLVLMDIRLQGHMDGITAAEEIRKRFDLPVIFLTAYSEEATLARAKLAQPHGYLLKPFDDRELKSAIEIALYKHRAEREILRLNRLYDVLSQVNQAIVRAVSRDDLLETICRIMVERSAIDLAWVGWLDMETMRIHPIAHWGRQDDWLSLAVFHADDRPEGQGNPGRAIREGKPVFCNECIRGNCLFPAEFAPAQFGFNSCGSFPIRFRGQFCGALNLVINEAGFFQEREVELLKEVAVDISFALDKLDGDAKRVQAEENLRKSEERYRLLVETSNEGIWAMDADHVTTYVNRAMAEMLGYEPSEIMGTKVEEYFYAEDLSFHRERMKRRHAGQDEVYERRFRRRDGSPLWTLVSAKTLKDDQGRFLGSFAMFTDITERKLAEKSLRESEERHRSIIQAAMDGYTLVDLEGHVLEVNEKYCRMSGYSAEELMSMRTFQLDADHTADEILEHSREMLERGEARFEARHRRKDGTVYDVEISIQYRPTDGGQLVAFLRDITERKQAEERLMKSERKFRSILDQAAEIILVHDLHGRFLDVNRQACRSLGYSKEELLAMNVADIDPQAIASGKARLWESIAEGKRFTFESRQKRKDGSLFPVEVTIGPIEIAEETLVLGIVRDITERKQMESALKERERLFSQVFHQAPQPIAITRQDDGVFVEVNKPFEQVSGYRREETLGKTVNDLNLWVNPPNGKQLAEIIKQPGAVHDFETSFRTKSGDLFPALCLTAGIEIRGEPCFITTILDITERKRAAEEKERLESQLRHAQKLEAIGVLAGGIAHDFNNILSPILGYTEMAMDGLPDSDPLRYDLSQVLTAANRAKDLVKQILSFSRLGEEPLMRPVEVSLIVKEALKLLRASLPSTVEIRQNIHKVTVVADATQIHQVVVNLCTNAAQAMEDMGVLAVSLLQVDLSAQDIAALSIADLRPGKHLKLSVQDTGKGMSPDTMRRIFDPYFTTKDVGKGTGLGLAVVHGIVKRHGGEIVVRSEVGKGSVFDVLIPVVESTMKHEGGKSETLPRGSERILLIDDEPAIVAMEARILEQLGYRVTAKTNPEEALDLFRSQPWQFDLIITDYTMPKMVGADLARECVRIRTEIPVIVCSGHSERLNREDAVARGVKAVALKPLDRRQLAMLVRETLDKATG